MKNIFGLLICLVSAKLLGFGLSFLDKKHIDALDEKIIKVFKDMKK